MNESKKEEHNLREIAKLFLKLGVTAFGGPAAHIAMMEDEVVTKRKWITHQHFLDLIGATNLIPGPNSTEMAIHTGFTKAGVPGLIIAGSCFIFPAFIITCVLAYFYSSYGSLPEVTPFLYGIKPAVIIIILNAVYKLSTKAVWISPAKVTEADDSGKRWKLISIVAAVAIINFAGVNEIFSILSGGIFGALFIFLTRTVHEMQYTRIPEIHSDCPKLLPGRQ
jgi:chromate transporter